MSSKRIIHISFQTYVEYSETFIVHWKHVEDNSGCSSNKPKFSSPILFFWLNKTIRTLISKRKCKKLKVDFYVEYSSVSF